MAEDLLAARAKEIVDIWVENLPQDSRVGEDGFVLHRDDLAKLVLGTIEIVLRRVSGGLANKGVQIGDYSTQHNDFRKD